MIPDVLNKAAKTITQANLRLPVDNSDGRSNSIQAENDIIETIQKNGFKIKKPRTRHWYDIKIDNFYCNIKVSEMTGNDNTIGKRVIYYFLTGKTKRIPNAYNPFFKSMKQNEKKDEQRDYYFIVVRKEDSKAFIISLKNLKVKAAPNNPPFQCNWSENTTQISNRSWEEAKKYLLKKWCQSIQKRYESYLKPMKEHYNEFF